MNSPQPLPLVTIGVIAYNEERFIRTSLADLLAQDYPNLEILIADNCSSDRTADICREAAESDPRIQFVQHERNIGSAANSVFVFDNSRGKYFMWAAGHDRWRNDYVSRCVAALDSHPDAVIALGTNSWIDAQGQPLEKESGWYDTRGMGPVRRFFFAFWGNLHPVLGVVRADCLRAIPKIFECVGTDQILLTDLSLRGDFIHVPAAHWQRRQPRDRESYKDRMRRYTGNEFRITGSWIDRRLPLLRLPIEQSRSILRSDLRILDKLLLLLALFPAFLLRYIDGRRA